MESIFPSTRSDCTWVLSRFLSAIINTHCQSNPLKLFFCYESCLCNIVFKDKFRIIVNPFTIIHFLSDHSLTMLAGLGTLGFEILEQCDCNLDAVVVPGSDANLLRALRYSIKRIFPQIKVMVSEDINRSETSHCFNTVSLVWYAKYSSWGRKSQGKRVCKRYVEYIASSERGNIQRYLLINEAMFIGVHLIGCQVSQLNLWLVRQICTYVVVIIIVTSFT